MYSFRTKIKDYEENKTFLSRSFGSKNYFLSLYRNLYSEKEKSKEFYIQVLCELNVAIIEGNLNSYKNISKILSYIVDYEKPEEVAPYFQEDIYPFKETNVVILACKYNRLEILKHIFANYSTIYKRLFKNEKRALSPHDRDENFHNAFYYSIRLDNTDLIETLIKKWPINYFDKHPDDLDAVLSQAYEELKIKNVILFEATEIFVESKLINLRFFSRETNSVPKRKVSLPNIIERITLVIEQIKSVTTDSEINEEFLFKLKCITQNVNTLKRLITITYSKVPWEEMEFCLVCFTLSFTQMKEINLFYRTVLTKDRMLRHLSNFAGELEKIKNEIGAYKLNALSNFPKLSRRLSTEQIVKRNREYAALYEDYEKVSDINTLSVISNYVYFASTADVETREGQIVISRSLQVLGECMRNSLQSPKLTHQMSDLLLLTLAKGTRNKVFELRNSLSHARSLTRRTDIQKQTNVTFFQDIQNDIKKLGYVLNHVFVENKLKTVRHVLEMLVNCKDCREAEEIIATFNMEVLDKLMPENLNFSESKIFAVIVDKLKRSVHNETKEETKILQSMDEILHMQSTELESKIDRYSFGISELRYFHSSLCGRIDEKRLRLIKFQCRNALEGIMEKSLHPQPLKYLAEMAVDLLMMHETKLYLTNIEELQTIVCEIICLAKIQLDNFQVINDLREQTLENRSANHYQARNYTTKDEYKEQLVSKLSDLRSILKHYKLDNPASIVLLKNKKCVLAALEILILDIMTILEEMDNRLDDNFFYLDQSIPVLIGKNLRNHLARCDVIMEILPSDPVTVLILNARIMAEKLEGNLAKIGGHVEEDPAKLRSKFNLDLKVIRLTKRMFDALEAGDFEALKSCIAQGADIHSRKRNDWTALHAAAKGGNVDIVKFVVDEKVSVKEKSARQQNPLHVAAANGSDDVVDHFVKKKYYSLEDTDDTQKTPLHLAALNNRKSTVEILLQNKAEICRKDKSGSAPLHLAIQRNHLEVVRVLLKKEKNVDANLMLGSFTALHVAVEAGCLDVVNLLLSRGANVNAASDNMMLPLHLAAMNGHTDIVRVLIQRRSEVNVRTWDGCTPLLYATENGHKQIVYLLLEAGANPNILAKRYNFGPIHFAARNGHEEIMEALLEHDANMKASTSDGKSPLVHAAEFGRLEIVRLLHEFGANLKGNDGCAALQRAAKFGHAYVVAYLIDYVADVNDRDPLGNTPLHNAAAGGHDAIVSLLITRSRAKVNARNARTGYTPLLAALRGCIQGVDGMCCRMKRTAELIFVFKVLEHKEIETSQQHRYERIIEILLNRGADPKAKSVVGTSALHVAAASGNCNIVEMLLRRNVSVNQQSRGGMLPLHIAVMFKHEEIVKLLLEYNSNVNFLGSPKYSALHFAVEIGHKEIVRLLLEHNANANEENEEGWAPASVTVLENQADILNMLIESGADLNEDEKSFLELSIVKGSVDVLRLYLRHSTVRDDLEVMNHLLHYAIGRDSVGAVQALVEYGAPVDGEEDNVPALLHAVGKNRQRIVEILLKNGANINGVRRDDLLSALHLTAMSDNLEVAEILLNHGINVNSLTNQEDTALHLALKSGSIHVVKLLFPVTGVPIDETKAAECGITLLHMAAFGGNVEVVRYLIDRGANINAGTLIGDKPIHTAVMNNRVNIVTYLLDRGFDVLDDTGQNGRSTLHYAAAANKVEIVELLMRRGADANARDNYGTTALSLAAESGTPELITILLENGAMYDLPDEEQCKPVSFCKNPRVQKILELLDRLFDAIDVNNLDHVRQCIKEGVLINVRCTENFYPLHHAVYSCDEAVVDELLEHGADPNVTGRLGLAPLHYAAALARTGVCKSLLSHGAIYNMAADTGVVPWNFQEHPDVTQLLVFIDDCFAKVASRNAKVVEELKRLRDPSVVKAVMRARDRNGKTLLASAVFHDFLKVDELRQVLRGFVPAKSRDDFDSALTAYKRALELKVELLGKYPLDIANAQADAAKYLRAEREALEAYTEAYEELKLARAENSEEALNVRSNMALVLHRLGRNEESLEIYFDVCERQRSYFTMDSPEMLSTLLHTAMVLIALGRNEDALTIYTEVYERRRATLGPAHEEVLALQNKMGVALKNLGRLDDALRIFDRVCKARKKALGMSHPDTLNSFYNLISVLDAQDKCTEALEAYEELLKMQLARPSVDTLDTLITQHSLAMFHLRQGRTVTALKMLKKLLPRMRQRLGTKHPDVVNGESLAQALEMSFQRAGFPELGDLIDHRNAEARAAVESGDLQALERLLGNDLDVNDADSRGRTLLHYACQNGRVEVARLLLENGARATRTSRRGNTPLHIAAHNGHGEIVRLLLGRLERGVVREYANARNNAAGDTALHLAAKAGWQGIVRTLLVHGAHFDMVNAEGKAPVAVTQSYRVIELLEAVEAMFDCARTGDGEVVRRMTAAEREQLEVFANARNREDKTLALVAIANKRKEVAREILEAAKRLS